VDAAQLKYWLQSLQQWEAANERALGHGFEKVAQRYELGELTAADEELLERLYADYC
jgi:hypothetical protein